MTAVFIRTLIMYIVIIGIMRFSGKRQLGELQLSELVVTILISELAAIPMQDPDAPVLHGVLAITLLICLEIIVSFGCMKLPLLKRLVDGRSCILIENGILDQKQMKKVRFTIDDLTEALRQKGITRLEDVNGAVLESSGKLSVIIKTPLTPATKSQLDPGMKNLPLPIAVISDGRLLKSGLKKSGLNKEDVEKLLKKNNIASHKEVFYLSLEGNAIGTLIKKEIQP